VCKTLLFTAPILGVTTARSTIWERLTLVAGILILIFLTDTWHKSHM
jgi:hypothetical protein